MYKATLTWLLALSFAGAAAQAPSDESAIRSILSAQVNDWNQGNVTSFMTGYWNNDSVMFITKKGPVYGYQPVLEHYKQTYPDKATMGTLSFSGLLLKRLSPDYYFVVGAFHLQRSAGNVDGQFSLLFRKIRGAWKIVVDHSST
jgi:ketosteroid isomerase-like protein